MAAELALPQHVFVHGFLLGADGRKMSKSLGNVLDPFEVIDAVRDRRAALLPDARRAVRRRRRGRDGRGAGALRLRARERVRQPREPHDRDDAALPRRRRSRRWRPIRRSHPSSRGCRPRSRRCWIAPSRRSALDLIWQRVRRLNRYVEERAPWQLARDPADAGKLDETLASLAEGLRTVSVLLHAVHAGDDRAAARRAGRAGGRLRARRSPSAAAAHGERARAAVPEARAVIDSHTHLELCEPPDAELVAAAVDAGVQRILTVGTDGASCRAALAAAEDFPQVYAAIGRHPNSADGLRRRRPRRARRRSRAHEKCVAIGETGLDYYRDYAPARRPGAGVRGPDRARARDRQAARDPHPRGRRRHAADARRSAPAACGVILHCFSMAERIERVPRAPRLVDLVRRQRHLPEGRGAARRGAARPGRAAAGRDRRAVPVAAAGPRQAEPAGERRAHRARRSRSSGGSRTTSSRRRSSERRRPCSDGEDAPLTGARPELPRRPQHPRRDRAARRALVRTTSCSRSAAGWASCRERLAARRRARARGRGRPAPRAAAARGARAGIATSRCTSPTRSSSTSARSTRRPTKVVANLPYGIAATVILRTIDELPSVSELGRDGPARGRRAARGARRAAPPTARPSVLAQLACEVKVLRPIARTVFRPVPQRRLGAGGAAAARARRPIPALRKLVHDAFAHRRKALAGSLALAPGAPRRRPRAGPGRAGRARPPGRRARRAAVAGGVPRAGAEAG